MNNLRALKAEADIIAEGVPEVPEGYEFSAEDVPADLKSGFEFKADDPMWATGKRLAHQHNLTTEQFKGLAEFMIRDRAQRESEYQSKSEAALAPLGERREQRIEAVKTMLRTRYPKYAAHVEHMLVAAPLVEFFETVFRASQAGAPAAVGNGVTQRVPDYDKLSTIQKLAIAHDRQAQQQGRR